MVVAVVNTELLFNTTHDGDMESLETVYTDESIMEINVYLSDIDNLWTGDRFTQLFSTDVADMGFKAYTEEF